MQRFALPNDTVSTTARQIEETINLKDPEDAVKYMPSLFVRKRNDGDNQAVLATRSWGLNSSARTLIYYDDLLVSALIGNNNTGASPHWNLISPEAIARIDFLDGPFAAAYPGNSIGGVLLITSKMPDKPFATAKETVSVMPWNQYGTKDTYVSSQTSAAAGNRDGGLSWLVSAEFLGQLSATADLHDQWLAPAGTTGTIAALNKQGVVPTSSVPARWRIRSRRRAISRLAYDLLRRWCRRPTRSAIWNNVQTSNPQTYLTSTATGLPTFGGVSSFRQQQIHLGSDAYEQCGVAQERHQGRLRFRPVGIELQLSAGHHAQPFTVAATGVAIRRTARSRATTAPTGRMSTRKGIWRPYGFGGPQEISFGVHGDRYYLKNPVYRSSVWNDASSVTGQTYSDGVGETRTGALWAQDAWKLRPDVKLTLGGRLEAWQALDGFNINTVATGAGIITSTTAINQPGLSRPTSRPRRRWPSIRTRTGTSPPISAKPIAIRPSPSSTRTSRSTA